jgi:hypothetical protein
MTQGIRAYTNARFNKYLIGFMAGEFTGPAFRAKVMDGTVSKFNISVASAATHYNHALKMARAASPESIEGLGRSEDKKGGRPVLNPVTVVNTRSGKVVVDGVSKGAADLLIAKAGTLKNGDTKLSIKVDVVAETVAVEAPAVAVVAETVTA